MVEEKKCTLSSKLNKTSFALPMETYCGQKKSDHLSHFWLIVISIAKCWVQIETFTDTKNLHGLSKTLTLETRSFCEDGYELYGMQQIFQYKILFGVTMMSHMANGWFESSAKNIATYIFARWENFCSTFSNFFMHRYCSCCCSYL